MLVTNFCEVGLIKVLVGDSITYGVDYKVGDKIVYGVDYNSQRL